MCTHRSDTNLRIFKMFTIKVEANNNNNERWVEKLTPRLKNITMWPYPHSEEMILPENVTHNVCLVFIKV